MQVKADFLDQREAVRLWNGPALPASLKYRLMREFERLELVNQPIRQLEIHRREMVKTSSQAGIPPVRDLMRLRGIGFNRAWLLVLEFFSWREFNKRREVGACAGLTPRSYPSGATNQEPGISKAGNRHSRG